MLRITFTVSGSQCLLNIFKGYWCAIRFINFSVKVFCLMFFQYFEKDMFLNIVASQNPVYAVEMLDCSKLQTIRVNLSQHDCDLRNLEFYFCVYKEIDNKYCIKHNIDENFRESFFIWLLMVMRFNSDQSFDKTYLTATLLI